MFLSHLQTRATTAARQAAAARIPPVLQPATAAIRSLWAARTWASRASLLLRSQLFAAQHRLLALPIGVQHTAFVANLTNCNNSTKANYCSALASTSRRLGYTVPMLELLASSLRAEGSTTPIRQAPPASRTHVFALVRAALQQEKSEMAAGLYLCWKSASRWDDIRHLTPASVLQFDPQQQQLILQWGRTKTNRRLEHRPDSWVVIVEEDRRLAWMWELLRRVLARRGAQRLVDVPTDEVRRLMRSTPGTEDLTAHSIKRGAVQHLVEAALHGRLDDPRLIPLLAKHRDELHAFPQATLRYVPDKTRLALMLGTQKATRLL